MYFATLHPPIGRRWLMRSSRRSLTITRPSRTSSRSWDFG